MKKIIIKNIIENISIDKLNIGNFIIIANSFAKFKEALVGSKPTILLLVPIAK